MREENETPSRKLRMMDIRLQNLFQLINMWSQYIEVIYMTETEIEHFREYEEKGALKGREND